MPTMLEVITQLRLEGYTVQTPEDKEFEDKTKKFLEAFAELTLAQKCVIIWGLEELEGIGEYNVARQELIPKLREVAKYKDGRV